MKLTKSWTPAVLAVLTIFLFSWRPWPTSSTGTSPVLTPDSLPWSLIDTYGFDRLEEADGEQWLPAVEVAATAKVKTAVHQLTTVAWPAWQQYAERIRYYPAQSAVLPLAPGGEIQLWRARTSVFPTLFHHLQTWTPFREQTWSTNWPAPPANCAVAAVTVVVLKEENLTQWTAEPLLGDLPAALAALPALVLYFGEAEPTSLLQLNIPLLWLPSANESSEAMATQALFGAMDLGLADGERLLASRLGHAPPEAVGIDRTSLDKIDRYVAQAIRRRAMPGCQVLVAKDGKIILERSYGHHTYDEVRVVTNQDVYDLASVTKAAATTLGLMRLYDREVLHLEDRLRELAPDYQRSNIRYLRLRHLLAHHTGLQSNLPIARWLRAEDSFRRIGSSDYPHALDQDFYLKSGIREAVLAQMKRLRIPRRLFYRYSDVNFLLLQEVLEEKSGQSLDRYLSTHFYEPLGLQRLQFRPGLHLPADEIVPTEYDKKWRKGLVQGEVHDESAALLGGVAGHAGLFSNARDLATVFQMLLQQGSYGGRTYLQATTIATFTDRNRYNYRAYGFDRLAAHSKSLRYYGAGLEAFGHTGFTGTCVWADPAQDLIFIFLSNRIYPSKYNNKLQQLGLRERLHKLVYQSLGTAKSEV